MKTIAGPAIVLCVSVWVASSAAQTPVEALAIRSWQTSRGTRADGASVAMLRHSVRKREPAGVATASSAAPAVSPARQPPPPASADVEVVFWQSIANSTNPVEFEAYVEVVFWQSIANSTNPVEFEAYLAQFPNGVFRALAEARLAVLRASSGAAFGGAASVDGPRGAGDVFRDCATCPEMVVLAGGGLAMGRYEVTVGEYWVFVSATGGTGDDRWRDHDVFPQADRHPVVYVSWNDAQAYVGWLSRTTGATYRLPTELEWQRAASGSPVGVGCAYDTSDYGTCPVGSYGANPAGMSDMLGNVWEWTSECWEGDCGSRGVRGGSWFNDAVFLRPGARVRDPAGYRFYNRGFRVLRMLD